MAELTKGDRAPAFSAEDQDGSTVSLSDFKGRKLLLYFYPRANTPGCTTQSCLVRDAKDDLSGVGVDVVGVSPDTPKKQKNFDEKHHLGFPLLADTEHEIAEAYDVWREKKMYGKTHMGIVRSSFLVDEEGTIVESWYAVKPKETVALARDALGALSE